MSILDKFAKTLEPGQEQILHAVRAYIQWRGDNLQNFTPGIGDDVDLRTYLLNLRLQGLQSETLQAREASLERFYAWAQSEGLIGENPFEEYNLRRPILPLDQVRRRQDIFSSDPQEREIARLRALNSLASGLNRAASVQSALQLTLETLVEVMELKTAWAFVNTASGLVIQSAGQAAAGPALHDFVLEAAVNLPPGLERDRRYFLARPPDCHCQTLLRHGSLERAVNIVECSRLESSAEAHGDNRGLLFHASVPISLDGQPVGIMNFATEEWQFLSAADLQLLSAAGKQVSAALERARLYDLVRMQKDQLERELEMARMVQSSLIPEQLPKIPPFNLAATWRAARQVAGDFYDVIQLSGNRWGLVIADVADKGAPAALFMAMTRSLIRSHAGDVDSPAQLVARVNRDLCRQSTAGMFVTLFYALLDPQARRLSYTLAGHNPPLIRRADGQLETLVRSGMALGVMLEAEYSQAELSFAPGDYLVMYTDGLTEALNPDGQEYGLDGLLAALQDDPDTAQELLEHLLADLAAFSGSVIPADDITLCVLLCEPSS
jgi:serine phosphatase RsbU (regulator of sigma subunit)